MSYYDRLTPEQARAVFVDEGDTIECNPCFVQPGIQKICRVIDQNNHVTAQINEEASQQEFLFHCQETDWRTSLNLPLSWHIERLGSQIVWVRYQKNDENRSYWTVGFIAFPSGQTFVNHHYSYYRKNWYEILSTVSKKATPQRRAIIADVVNDVTRHPEWFHKYFRPGDILPAGKL